jgi:DNA-binding response OmpR family regulator
LFTLGEVELSDAHILVVDDDFELRALVRRFLANQGCSVSEASDVPEALKLALEHAPHAILTDLNMPGNSGFALIEACQRSEALRSVPVVVLSALKDQQSVYRAISLGAKDYLLKPFNAPNLLIKMRALLSAATQRRYAFPEGARPLIRVSCAGQLLQASEAGLRVGGTMRLWRESPLAVEGPAIADMGLLGCQFRTSPNIPLLSMQGEYVNELIPVGVTEAELRSLRAKLREWRHPPKPAKPEGSHS